MPRSSGTFTTEDNRASEASKKQKRGISMRDSLLKILEVTTTKEIITEKKAKEIIQKAGFKDNKKTLGDIVNLSLFAQAVQGNTIAIKEINERIDGKAGLREGDEPEEIELIFKIKEMSKVTRKKIIAKKKSVKKKKLTKRKKK